MPTISEAGVPGYQVTVWYGIFATGRTPQPVLDRINAGFVQAVQSPDVRQQLNAMGLEAVGNSSAEFAKNVRGEIRQWREVIRRAGVKPE